jgi:hypothetical protein
MRETELVRQRRGKHKEWDGYQEREIHGFIDYRTM